LKKKIKPVALFMVDLCLAKGESLRRKLYISMLEGFGVILKALTNTVKLLCRKFEADFKKISLNCSII